MLESEFQFVVNVLSMPDVARGGKEILMFEGDLFSDSSKALRIKIEKIEILNN